MIEGVYPELLSILMAFSFVFLCGVYGQFALSEIATELDSSLPYDFHKETIFFQSKKILYQYRKEFLWSALLFSYVFRNADNCLGPALLLSFLLGIGAAIDKRYFILPDEICYLLILSGSTYRLFRGDDIQNFLISACIGGGVFWILRISSGGGIGLGDVKWSAALGFWLTWQEMLVMIVLAFWLGSIYALFFVRERSTYIPFGPFLCMGALTAYLHGETILSLYMSLF